MSFPYQHKTDQNIENQSTYQVISSIQKLELEKSSTSAVKSLNKVAQTICLAIIASSKFVYLEIGAGIPSIAFGGRTNPSLKGD